MSKIIWEERSAMYQLVELLATCFTLHHIWNRFLGDGQQRTALVFPNRSFHAGRIRLCSDSYSSL